MSVPVSPSEFDDLRVFRKAEVAERLAVSDGVVDQLLAAGELTTARTRARGHIAQTTARSLCRYPVAVPDSLLLVRFGPWSAEKMEATSRDQFEEDLNDGVHPPRYSVSVFGDVPREGESSDDVIARICLSVPCNGRMVAVVTAGDMMAAGFEIHEDMPPDMHYLVGQGNLTIEPDADALAVLWNSRKQRNPVFQKRKG